MISPFLKKCIKQVIKNLLPSFIGWGRREVQQPAQVKWVKRQQGAEKHLDLSWPWVRFWLLCLGNLCGSHCEHHAKSTFLSSGNLNNLRQSATWICVWVHVRVNFPIVSHAHRVVIAPLLPLSQQWAVHNWAPFLSGPSWGWDEHSSILADGVGLELHAWGSFLPLHDKYLREHVLCAVSVLSVLYAPPYLIFYDTLIIIPIK